MTTKEEVQARAAFIIRRMLEVPDLLDFSLQSEWQWYWPRSKYVHGELLPIVSCVGVLTTADERGGVDYVRIFSRGMYCGEVWFPREHGHEFAEKTLDLIKLPAERKGCQFYKELEGGRDVSVYLGAGGESRVCVSRIESGGIDDAYYYPSLESGIAAAIAWDGTSEPLEGWNRHLRTDRWRVGGDPNKESIGEPEVWK